MTDSTDGILGFYRRLGDKPDTTIRFFSRGDFYSILGADATYAANEVFKSTNNIKYVGSGENKCEILSLNKNQFSKLVRDLLLVHQYRVEVYEGRGSDWNLEYKGSPGNLSQFEDLIYNLDESEGDDAVVMAIKRSGRKVGICCININQCQLVVYEFEDDDALTSLEGVLVQTAPKEVVLPVESENTLSKVVQRFGCPVHTQKASIFSTDALESTLNRLLLWQEGQSENALALPEMQLLVASSALSAAINYTEVMSNEIHHNKFTLATLTPGQYVHLDASAARALGLVSGPGSLVRHLDRCRTPAGKRLLAVWVKRPLRDVALINQRLEIVEMLASDSELRVNISEENLRGLPDLEMVARKINRKAASLQECYKVYQALGRVKQLQDVMKASASQASIFVAEVISLVDEYLEQMTNFVDMMVETVDMDCAERGDFIVRSTFSEELGVLREQIDEIMSKLEDEATRCANMLGLEAKKTLKLESTSQHGYFFRTPSKKEEKNFRDKGMHIIDSTKAGMRFRNAVVEKLSSQVVNLKEEYEACQRTIVQEIVNIAAGYTPAILGLSGVIAKLDVLTSFATVSANAPTPYVRPNVTQSGKIVIKGMRHPLVETLVPSFITNDVELSHDEVTFEIITGPNMGGKSTYLRTVGTCALLAQIGCFVPCDFAEITALDAILSRVGASDCQLAGVSTFMNEMVETAAILKRATPFSLVLIDELGRGTSTYEGCGLAWAIAKTLADLKSFTLFATHFQEMTVLDKEESRVRNRHVSAVASDDGLALLYRLLDGPTDRSFGIEVARAAKLPDHVIEDAKNKLIELEQRQGLGMSGVNLTAAEVEEGERLVKEFLQSFVKAKQELPQLKSELLAKKHPYVTAMLS